MDFLTSHLLTLILFVPTAGRSGPALSAQRAGEPDPLVGL